MSGEGSNRAKTGDRACAQPGEERQRAESIQAGLCWGDGVGGAIRLWIKKTPKTQDIKGQMVYAIIIIFNSTKKLSSPDYELGIILRDENRKK